ncbi:T9SS type A sorting domain-containing protein [bacterium]|nr:T9SS type A sorting domain-containing protein [bacterium]
MGENFPHLHSRENGNQEIDIFDIDGRMVGDLSLGSNSKPARAGGSRILPYEIVWQPDKFLGSGIYLVHVMVGDSESTKRIVYLR